MKWRAEGRKKKNERKVANRSGRGRAANAKRKDSENGTVVRGERRGKEGKERKGVRVRA